MSLPARPALVALLLVGCAVPSEACPCDEGHGVTLCDGGECTACQCLGFAPATVDPAPMATRFVDADATGGDGSEGSPWAVVDWDVLDADASERSTLPDANPFNRSPASSSGANHTTGSESSQSSAVQTSSPSASSQCVSRPCPSSVRSPPATRS